MAEAVSSSANPKINIKEGGMEATITLPMPQPGQDVRYTPALMITLLQQAGVVFGIDQNRVMELSKFPIYNREITVATGINTVDGQPGWFEYHFDTDLSRKPKINDDGTTDYMSIKMIETVEKGQIVATYHPAVQGSRGTSVKGTSVEPKPVRDLPAMGGRGFERCADNVTYKSLIDGKIELSGNRIIISPVYEIFEDACISTGNIEFNGDVVVHGGAKDGVRIKAAGSITIDKLVENCEIECGRDLFLLKGVKGGEKTNITCHGNVTAQFIEYANIFIGGNIVADYIFKSKLVCYGRLELTGKKSSIIGGTVTAVQGVDVNIIGNDFGTVTNVAVGLDEELRTTILSLKQHVEEAQKNINRIKEGIAAFDEMCIAKGIDYKSDQRRMQLLRVKIREESAVAESRDRLEQLEEVASYGNHASIKVFDTVYSGVNVSIDDHRVSMTDFQRHIEFVKTLEGIRMDVLEGIIKT